MTDNVFSLAGRKIDGVIQQDVVDLLSEMLDRAKSGELQAVAICYVPVNSGVAAMGTDHATGNGGYMPELAGAVLAQLHHFSKAIARAYE